METHCRVCDQTRTIVLGDIDEGCLCNIKAQERSINTMNEILTIARKAGMKIEPIINIKLEGVSK
tara:strand:+ start:312 stop:506 length:195 start_codon:yes stop_codon:yes gene_type:complete